MSRTKMRKDKRKVIRTEKTAIQMMWNHYKLEKNRYIEEIKIYRNPIIYELMRVKCVESVFTKYRCEVK